MNADCMFSIFEHLKFVDLLNFSQINDKLSTVASAAIFRHKYSHFQIVFRYNFPIPNNLNKLLNGIEMKIDTEAMGQANKRVLHLPGEAPIETETQIELGDYDRILNTFKHFGHVIKRIKSKMFAVYQPVQAELIGKLITKYSSEALLEIEVEFFAENLLRHITKPLINVENLTFERNDLCPNRGDIRLAELFPAVRRLNLDSFTLDDLDYFNFHMSNLQHLGMHGSILYDRFSCMEIITKNPQI